MRTPPPLHTPFLTERTQICPALILTPSPERQCWETVRLFLFLSGGSWENWFCPRYSSFWGLVPSAPIPDVCSFSLPRTRPAPVVTTNKKCLTITLRPLKVQWVRLVSPTFLNLISTIIVLSKVPSSLYWSPLVVYSGINTATALPSRLNCST